MTNVLDRPHTVTAVDEKTKEEKLFFQVFLGFRKPDGYLSIFGSCGIYDKLGRIFNKSPQEIYTSIEALVYEGGDGFMQEYLSLEAATFAVAQASLFANVSMCVCFLNQEAHFYIKEV